MNLFAYGTLLVPEIWRAVAGRDFPSSPATLRGYAIFRVRDADFPGIARTESGGLVPGRVFFDLDAETVARLDAYEDTFYERLPVCPADERGLPVDAEAYVVPNRNRALLSGETWTLDWFRAHAEADYRARLFSSP